MKKTTFYALIIVVFVLTLAGVTRVVKAQTGSGYDLTWWTVDNGGSGGGNSGDGKQLSGGDYVLLSTTGQHDADVTHNGGQISGGSYTLRSGFWPGENLVPSFVYLPIILKSPLPDLVGTFSLTPPGPYTANQPVEVTVVVTNQGTATADAFWVDFYINPSVTPSVNQRWDSICGISPCNGIAWLVPAGLQPGNSVTLTSNSYETDQSRWPGYFVAGTSNLHIYVDSWNPGVSTGGVVESNEANNLFSQGVTVSGAAISGQSTDPPNLPPRPAP